VRGRSNLLRLSRKVSMIRRPALNIAAGHLLRGALGGVQLAVQNGMGSWTAACATLIDEISGWMHVEHKKLADSCDCQSCTADREQKRMTAEKTAN
jgi:hypothetical protein